MTMPAPANDRACLVTGASSGIGAEMARLLGEAGVAEQVGAVGQHVHWRHSAAGDAVADIIDPVSGQDLATLWRAHPQFGEAFEVVDLE